MRLICAFIMALLSTAALAGNRPVFITTPDVALMLELDLIELDSLGGNVLASPERPVEVRVETFKKDGLLNNNLCDDYTDKLYARVKHSWGKSKIAINSKFIDLAYNNTNVFPCKHGTFRNFLKASLWHELGHVWDKQHDFSVSGTYSALMGGGSSFKATGNRAASASPDAYEFKNLRESFAVNLEWFLLDPDFECRRPATYQLLSEALGFKPHSKSCEENWNILTQSAYPEDHFTRAFDVNPDRIYQVHYFFAGKGDALMSRWGHAMLRLVVCAPHRKEIGPECMQDVSHHLVLSYRASIENPQINYVDGITGKYPSLMFVYRMHEILQEYGKQELRELWSVPLPLSREKIDFFMKVTMERYWGYQGKYLFLSNNCGTESLRHLLAVDEEMFDEIGDFTPLQIFKGLSRLDGFNEIIEDKEELRRRGLYFPSQRDELSRAINLLRENGFHSKKSLKDFIKLNPAERLNSYKSRDWEHTDPIENRTLLLNIQYLERYMALVYNLGLMNSITKKIGDDQELKSIIEKEVQSFLSLIKRPWDIAGDGYGVPSIEGFSSRFSNYLVERKAQAQNQNGSAFDTLLKNPKFEDESKNINTMKEIGKFLSRELLRTTNLNN